MDIRKEILSKKIELFRERAKAKGRFSLFETTIAKELFAKDLNYDKMKYFVNLYAAWDQKCNIPYNIGISLDRMVQDNTIMIHRTNLDINNDIPSNEKLESIMTNGLYNFGHGNAFGGSAFDNDLPPLTLTMSSMKGLGGWANLVSKWHGNDTVIIAAFPKDIVNEDGEILREIDYDKVYNYQDNGYGFKVPSVKTEYIIGAIINKNNGLDEFYTRNELMEMFANKHLRSER